jgi:pimeloyl-ACP methyl ester carboxylesterase
MRRSLCAFASASAFLVVGCGGGDNNPDAPPVTNADARIDARPTADADPNAVPRAEPATCRFDVAPSLGTEGTEYACGDLVVEETREAPTRHIRVHFIRFRNPTPATSASIYLDGGPGGDGQGILEYAAFLGPSFLQGLMVNGDFLVIGQRGTARSIPFLDCASPDCSDLAGEAHLPSYNTAANADDVDELRAVLGYATLDVYGISYGSRLGLEVLRRHGANVRAAVIEGLVPSQVVWPAAIPASFYGALTALNTSCANTGGCGAAYGDLVATFLVAVNALNTEPVEIEVGGGPQFLDGYTFAYLMFQMMYSRSSLQWLPLVVSDLAIRRTDRIAEFLELWLSQGGSTQISTGLYYGVVCGELYNPPHENAFEDANVGVPDEFQQIYGGSYFGLLEACASFPVGNLQASLSQPVASSVRTLVSSGAMDPITPPTFGAIAAETLSNSVVVVHADSGHGATLQSTCGQQNLFEFLADPTTPHDTSCAAAISTPYVLPSGLVATPVPAARIRAEMAIAGVPPMITERVRRGLVEAAAKHAATR